MGNLFGNEDYFSARDAYRKAYPGRMVGGSFMDKKENQLNKDYYDFLAKANEDGENGRRFASQYYAGTFNKRLNKSAVDTETLWQGYYPSLYNPHTQEAAAHLGAPIPVQIDPITGLPYQPEPEPDPRRGRYPGGGNMPGMGKKPTVNPRGKLVPWADPKWMVAMGQWRGT